MPLLLLTYLPFEYGCLIKKMGSFSLSEIIRNWPQKSLCYLKIGGSRQMFSRIGRNIIVENADWENRMAKVERIYHWLIAIRPSVG